MRTSVAPQPWIAPRREAVPHLTVVSPADRFASVASALEELTVELERHTTPRFAEAAQAVASLLRRPGKRIRPYLFLVGYESATRGPRPAGVANFAAALELLHVFLLIHDDVADRAESRRGAPALQVLLRPSHETLSEEERRHLGDQLAILGGDWLYTVALQQMLRAPGLDPVRVSRALDYVLETCRFTAEGQYADLSLSAESIEDVTPQDVLEVYRLKTARYTFESPLVAGALLGGAGLRTTEALARFATSAGVAFQLADDLLGLFASEEETGKPELADLREAKKTWPLLSLRAELSVPERAWLDEVLRRRQASELDLLRVRELMRRTGTLERTVSEIARLCDAASSALKAHELQPVSADLQTYVERIRREASRWR
jgi:geranylgeranyl diphosphate synthase type I